MGNIGLNIILNNSMERNDDCREYEFFEISNTTKVVI